MARLQVASAPAGSVGSALPQGDAGPQPAGEPYALVHETHTSVVILLGGRAYKVRKCVNLPFVDLSTPDRRLAVSRAEVELNRRFSPDVYLGVADLHLPGVIDDEAVVVMRRLPWDRRLASLVAEGRTDLVRACVSDVADRVARDHALQPGLQGFGLASTMAALWREGHEQLQRFTGRCADGSAGVAAPGVLAAGDVDDVARLALEYLDGRRALLDRREEQGLVRDGHGDLLADDIFWLDDGARILDCLEFDARLRHGDVLMDVAFLAMDLRWRGAGGAARLLLDRYAAHGVETHPRSLEHHYVAYRAFVRAKVECLKHAGGDAPAAGHARDLLALCRRELDAGRVHLLLLGGLPGSGKSTVARQVAGDDDTGDWLVLSSDVVRKEVCANTPDDQRYHRAHTGATYGELRRRAAAALADGVSVVLDASWTDAAQRRLARDVAAEHRAALTECVCAVPDDIGASRILGRADAYGSEATPAVRQLLAGRADRWPEAVQVDTGGSARAAAAAVRAALGRP